MESTSARQDHASYPDPFFLGIGAARSGTTWISDVLRAHPDIQMAKVKEMHYFNWSDPHPPKTSRIGAAALAAKRCLMTQRVQSFLLNQFYQSNIARRNLLRGQPNLLWYFDLFKLQGCAQIAGEFTPAYATLNDRQVQLIASSIPTAKILFIMRDPVDRLWSHYRYQIGKGLLSDAEVMNESQDFFLDRAQYGDTIERYERFFGADQMYLGYYEDMVGDPDTSFSRLCEFLEVAPPTDKMRAKMQRRINAAKTNAECPPKLRAAWQEQLKNEIVGMESRMGRVPAAWKSTPQ